MGNGASMQGRTRPQQGTARSGTGEPARRAATGRNRHTRFTWRRLGWLMGWAFVLSVAGGPVAERADARRAGEDWDSQGMRSRYRSVLETPLKAPELRGTGRYEALEGAAGATPGVLPPSTLPTYTQRTWKSGAYTGPGKRTTLGHGPSAGSGRAASSGGGTDARHRGKPPGLRPRSRGAGNSIGRSGGARGRAR